MAADWPEADAILLPSVSAVHWSLWRNSSVLNLDISFVSGWRSICYCDVAVCLSCLLLCSSGTLRSTTLSWLPVLANAEPPAVRRKAAVDKLVEKIIAHDNWPFHSDITNPPHACLPSRNGKKTGGQDIGWSGVWQILTSLVENVHIPVTCKIRILPSVSTALLIAVSFL